MLKLAILAFLFINFNFTSVQEVSGHVLQPNENPVEGSQLISCFDSVPQDVHQSYYHLFMNCAKDLSDHYTGTMMGASLSQCIWLDNLDFCLHREFQYLETDCLETFQTMIAEQVEAVSTLKICNQPLTFFISCISLYSANQNHTWVSPHLVNHLRLVFQNLPMEISNSIPTRNQCPVGSQINIYQSIYISSIYIIEFLILLYLVFLHRMAVVK